MRGYLKQIFLCGRGTNMDIPDATSFSNPRKKGSLLKLTGRGWLYAGSWKKRFCVLDGTKFYYYENERSRGAEKTSGVISLDYYDVCEEFDAKDKKNPYVFIIGTSVRGFFDNRHQFAAETEAEMQDWIRSVHDVITEARNIRIRAGRNRIGSDKVSPVSGTRIQVISQMSDDSQEHDVKEEQPTAHAQLVNATKDRVKGPQGRRLPQRKSMMPPNSAKEDDDDSVFKQRSFSLSGPAEDVDESKNKESPSENRRISLSMDLVDHTDQSDDAIDNQRSSSSYDLPTQRPEVKHVRKPIFGKLGGQHAALTKELEMKLKAGVAPGGSRFHERREEASGSEVKKEIETLNSRITAVQTAVDGLEEKVENIKAEKVAETESAVGKIRELLTEAQNILKGAEEIRRNAIEASVEAKQARDESREILEELRKALAKESQHKDVASDDSDDNSL